MREWHDAQTAFDRCVSICFRRDAEVPTADSSSCRLVIAHHQFSVNAALLVNRTLGLKNASVYRSLDASPGKPWIARTYKDAAEDEWIDLNFPALLNNSEFMKVEAVARS